MDYNIDLILVLCIVFLPIIANIAVTSSFKKYLKVKNTYNLTGKDVAEKLLSKHGLSHTKIVRGGGQLTDYFDSKNNMVVLSADVYDNSTISSVAVAAHEVGHAIQYSESYTPLKFRNSLVPVVNISSKLSTVFIFLGLILGFLNLFDFGIILLLAGLLFHLVTLPIEFNASKRAREELLNLNLITNDEVPAIKSVLRSAAFTYVAGFIAMALQILRLFALRNRD